MFRHKHGQPFFHNQDFQFSFESALGATYRDLADAGEVLATAARIKDGDADSWLAEWLATAGAMWAAAGEADAAGHRVSALAYYRRAATYYATALYLIAHTSEPERQLDIWRRQRECWDRIVDRFPVPGRARRDSLRGHDAARLVLPRARTRHRAKRVRWS